MTSGWRTSWFCKVLLGQYYHLVQNLVMLCWFPSALGRVLSVLIQCIPRYRRPLTLLSFRAGGIARGIATGSRTGSTKCHNLLRLFHDRPLSLRVDRHLCVSHSGRVTMH